MVAVLVVAALAVGGLIGALLNRRRPTPHTRPRRGMDSADPIIHAGWTNHHGS